MSFRLELLASTCGAVVAAACLAGCLAGEDARNERFAPPAPPPGWPRIAWPADNPYTPAKAELGKILFFETRLSRNNAVSCAWCHAPAAAFTDMHHGALSTGVGTGITRRNPSTLLNAAFGTSFMYDGAAASLEEQAVIPLLAENEMAMTAAAIESTLSADAFYVAEFARAFGKGPVTLDKVAKALATWQRTLFSHRSAYDRWAAGDTAALDASARRGAALFLGERGGCFRCHAPPLFTDGGFHDIGLDGVPVDPGRGGVTGLPGDVGQFKTPTLRNVSRTRPYMHDGRFWELEEVVRHYNEGGEASANRDARIKPLGLDEEEIRDLVAFLMALEDPAFLDGDPL